MLDHEALEDLSDHWHGQLQSTPEDRFKALSMCVDTNNSIERARDLISQQHIDLLRGQIQEQQCKIYIAQRLNALMECCSEIPKPPIWYDCEYERRRRSCTGYYGRRDYYERTEDGMLHYDPVRRGRRGRFVKEHVETETVADILGNEYTTVINPVELGENQIIRDDWLIQQYPYPDMTLELVIAYVGTGKEVKTNEPQETWVMEKPEFKPWFERLLMFLLSLVKRTKSIVLIGERDKEAVIPLSKNK